MSDEDSLEEYWADLRRKPPEKPQPRKKTREELDKAIIARAEHLFHSDYYRRQPEQEEEPSEEELRQAVLDRAPHLAEWVIRRQRRTEEEQAVDGAFEELLDEV